MYGHVGIPPADRRHSLFGHICRLPENTPASQTLQLSIEAHTSTSPAANWKRPPGRPIKLAATSGRRHWPICWCCPDRGPGSFDVEDATTLIIIIIILSWSSAAVSECADSIIPRRRQRTDIQPMQRLDYGVDTYKSPIR